MNALTFCLEGYVPFRIRFVTDERGSGRKIIGLYLNGTTDETSRSR